MTTDHFTPLLSSDQAWYSAKEVAGILGRSDQYVRDCFDSGLILGHRLRGRCRAGARPRSSYQVHRDAVLMFLLETANYTPEDFVDRLADLLRRRPPQERDEIVARARQRA